MGQIAASLLILMAFISPNMLALRSLAIAAIYIFLLALVSDGTPWQEHKNLILLGSAAIAINLIHIAFKLKESIFFKIPNELKPIHRASFSEFTPQEFLDLYKLSSKKFYKKSDVIIEEKVHVKSIYMILDGESVARRNQKEILTLHPNDFIGEMSYIANKPSAASVTVTSDALECLLWDQEKLTI